MLRTWHVLWGRRLGLGGVWPLVIALVVIGAAGTFALVSKVTLAEESGQRPVLHKTALVRRHATQTRRRIPAPSLEGGVGWINTDAPLRIEDLRGKVVLLDFWTYCCINCIHMIPILRQLEEKYPNGLVVIGVHSAKFETEKDSESIRKAVQRFRIQHPVVNDANLVIWQRYGVESWPSYRLIDPEGFYVGGDSGEMSFEDLDAAIAPLMRKFRRRGKLDESPLQFQRAGTIEDNEPLRFPGKVLADGAGGKLYISDSGHNRIVVTSLEGQTLDVIGSGARGARDGSYNDASFDSPQGLVLNGETLYVADTGNHLIREIDLEAKTVKTLAGTGKQAPFGSRGGRLDRASLSSPWDLTLVEDKLFIAMAGLHQIWRLDLRRQTVRPFSGSGREDILDGSLASAAHAQPSGITTDGEMLYIVDSEGNAVRVVSSNARGSVRTLVGPVGLPQAKSLFAFGDRDGQGPQVRLQHPMGLTFDRGVIYVADSYNHKIKQIDPFRRVSVTLFGDGQAGRQEDPPRFHEPSGVSVAKDKLFIADTNNHRIRVADFNTGKMQTLQLRGLESPVELPKAESVR